MKEIIKNFKYKKVIIVLSVILGILILIYLYISLSFIFSKNHKRDINSESISPRVLLSGGGNEPGWNFRIIGEDINKGEVSINLITSYGEHNWGGILGKTWQENYAQNFQYRGDIHELIKNGSSTSISSTTKNIIIYFEKKECLDDAGKSHNLSVDLDINSEQDLKGCADIILKGIK